MTTICCSPPEKITDDPVPEVGQLGKVGVDPFEVLLGLAPVLPEMRTNGDVFLGGQVLEDHPAFDDLHDAHLDDFFRGFPVDAPALELDVAGGDLALLDLDQAGDGLEGRALSGAVGAQQADDFALLDEEGHPLEHEDRFAVNHVNVVQLQHNHFPVGPNARLAPCARGF